jgi:Uma2 family endonuclease
VQVLFLDAPRAVLDERRRLGLDRRDEVWNGVLHVVPPPGGPHQRLSTAFLLAVGAVAAGRGLVPHAETGLFRAADDYRVPDQLYCRPEHLSDRGVEGAELVVEVRSDGDETYRKLPFYAAAGVREALVLHPRDRTAELFRAIDGELRPVSPDAEGGLHSDVLGVHLRTVDGQLRITWSGGAAAI